MWCAWRLNFMEKFTTVYGTTKGSIAQWLEGYWLSLVTNWIWYMVQLQFWVLGYVVSGANIITCQPSTNGIQKSFVLVWVYHLLCLQSTLLARLQGVYVLKFCEKQVNVILYKELFLLTRRFLCWYVLTCFTLFLAQMLPLRFLVSTCQVATQKCHSKELWLQSTGKLSNLY